MVDDTTSSLFSVECVCTLTEWYISKIFGIAPRRDLCYKSVDVKYLVKMDEAVEFFQKDIVTVELVASAYLDNVASSSLLSEQLSDTEKYTLIALKTFDEVSCGC